MSDAELVVFLRQKLEDAVSLLHQLYVTTDAHTDDGVEAGRAACDFIENYMGDNPAPKSKLDGLTDFKKARILEAVVTKLKGHGDLINYMNCKFPNSEHPAIQRVGIYQWCLRSVGTNDIAEAFIAIHACKSGRYNHG